MDNNTFTKWVACWGNGTSITDRKESVYSKDLTLRYPVRIFFSGSKLRFRFSNFTGTEPIEISKAVVARKDDSYTFSYITFNNDKTVKIEPGQEIQSDEIDFLITAGETVDVSIYLEGYTQMNTGVLVTGPLSSGKYCYGDYCESKDLPVDLTRNTNWFYFLNTIDIFTEEKNHALICFGDSITAQSWPDYLALRAWENGFHNVSIIRRAVSGTRILRQYDCITYAAYGLKGETRFPLEMNVAGAKSVIIQHGINDIIHPVGIEVNQFRPWEDLPTLEELIDGVENIYLKPAKNSGLNVFLGTLLPIFGWRTYADFREELKNKFNEWIRNNKEINGCIDFDKAVRNPNKPEAFADGFDSGDHLHPSEKAYKTMADIIPEALLK